MDYKELIERLRTAPKYKLICNDAATAIETLLAEREALLSEIKGECHFCAFEWGACVGCDDGSEWQ